MSNHPPLPRKLDAVLAMIPPSAVCIADIGYEHGHLIRKIIRRSATQRVIGVELEDHFAEQFWRLHTRDCRPHAARIDLRTGRGLRPLAAGEADTLVLAGIGETNTAEMLAERMDVLAAAAHIIVAPSTYLVKLRRLIDEMGYHVAAEEIAFEKRRFYPVLALTKGRDPQAGSLEWRFGPRLFENRHPALAAYLSDLKKRLTRQIAYVERQGEDMQALCRDIDEAIRRAAALSR